jgi:hypothetical protein
MSKPISDNEKSPRHLGNPARLDNDSTCATKSPIEILFESPTAETRLAESLRLVWAICFS